MIEPQNTETNEWFAEVTITIDATLRLPGPIDGKPKYEPKPRHWQAELEEIISEDVFWWYADPTTATLDVEEMWYEP